ncbi:MAG TPA: FUSC family protein [Geminicoccaceae bacterium]|nr:FUSC family protein [Geminicoccaceae bacterium]
MARFALPVRLGVPGTAARFAARLTLAAVLTQLVASGLDLPQAFWAVVTALVVVQGSLGGTIGAGVDRMIATLVGAVAGSVVAVARVALATPETLALAVAIVPLAMAAAIRPSFRMAPITATIILIGSPPGLPPLEAALHRVGEIALGSFIGITVSLLVFPARAHRVVAERVAETLRVLGEVVERHLHAATASSDTPLIEKLNDRTRRTLTGAESAAVEAAHERRSRLTDAPPPDRLLRTTRRLRSDAAMIGRATLHPLPGPLAARVAAELLDLAAALRSFLEGAGTSLANGAAQPDLAAVDAAIQRFLAAWRALRPELERAAGALEQADRLMALPFAVETLRRDLGDLAAALAELDPAARASGETMA